MEEKNEKLPQLEELIMPEIEKNDDEEKVKKCKCSNFLKDIVFVTIQLVFCFLTFSAINIMNICFCVFIIYTALSLSSQISIITKKSIMQGVLLINAVYLVSLIIFFAIIFGGDQKSLYSIGCFFLVNKKKKNFSIFHFVLYLVNFAFILIYYKITNFDKSIWNKEEYDVVYHFIEKCKQFRKPISSIGLYCVCLGACMHNTTINFLIMLIVLFDFIGLVFSKPLNKAIKKLIYRIFCFLLPGYIVFTYTINFDFFFDIVNQIQNKPLYGIVILYREEDYEIKLIGNKMFYHLNLYKCSQLILFIFGFSLINLYLNCKALKVKENLKRKDTSSTFLYSNDIDNAIMSFFLETENKGIFSKVRIFLTKYCYSPSFFLHFCRIGMIIYINVYITYVSLLLIIWVWISMTSSEKKIFLNFSRFIILPVMITFYSLSYLWNIEGAISVKSDWVVDLGMVNYTSGGQSDVVYHMVVKITLIMILQTFLYVKLKYNEMFSKTTESREQRLLLEEHIAVLQRTKYVLEPREILFKVVFFCNDIMLIVFLYLGLSQSINIFNEIMLLFIISLFIFSKDIDKYYFSFLIFIGMSFLLKYITFFSFGTKSTTEEYNNTSYNILSLLYYDELKKIFYYWIAYYFLYINYINQESELFKISKKKTFSVYELIEYHFSMHLKIKLLLTTICDFIFGIYIWLLVPLVLICILLQENNLIFLILLLIIFIIYYKFIRIAGVNYRCLDNIYIYTWILIINSIIILVVIFIAQFLNKKPFSLWYAMTSPRTKRYFELIGIFIFNGEYGYNFLAYMLTFVISIALHSEITRVIQLNTSKGVNDSNKTSYSKKLYILLYYILHYYWILIFIVVAILSIHWMLSISMGIQLILFSYYIMKSFRGYYNCLSKSELRKRYSSNRLKLYSSEKKEHFKITSENQLNYFNLVWKFTFVFIGVSYLSSIGLKLIDEMDDSIKNKKEFFSSTLYLLGFYCISDENFLYYSWGYFVIIGLFSFRAYFLTKFAEMQVREKNKKKNKEIVQIRIKRNFTSKYNESKDVQIIEMSDVSADLGKEAKEKENKSNDSLDSNFNDDSFNKTNSKEITVNYDFGEDISDEENEMKLSSEEAASSGKRTRRNSIGGNVGTSFAILNPEFNSFLLNHSMISTTSNPESQRNSQDIYTIDASFISNQNERGARMSFYPNMPRRFNLNNQLISKDDTAIQYHSFRKKKLITYSINIYLFIKRFVELITMVLVLLSAVIKVNIISFFLLICVISTFKFKTMTTKIMFNISLIVLSLLILQYLVFISNISYETSVYKNIEIIKSIEKTFGLPWCTKLIGFKWAMFFSCGVIRYQLTSLWVDVIILIILYFYLEFFSFTIYAKEDEKKVENYDKYAKKLKEITTLSTNETRDFIKAMKLSFGITLTDKVSLNQSNLNSLMIKDNSSRNKLKKEKRVRVYKYIRSYFYLSFHYIALVSILLFTSFNKGLIALCYIGFSMFYVYQTHSFLKGRKWTFERGLMYFLKPFLFVDIISQFIFQIPFDIYRETTVDFDSFFKIFGYARIVNYSSKKNLINKEGLVEMIIKLITYALLLIQEVIYTSYDFKRFILKYHLDYMQKAYIKGKLNAFLFNNHRIQMMNERLEERKEINDTLRKVEVMIMKWNDKLTTDSNKASDAFNHFDLSEKKKFKNKKGKLSISRILRKHWLIKSALSVYEESRCLNNEKIRNKKEIMHILKGNIMIKSDLEREIDKFNFNNTKDYPLLEKVISMKNLKSDKNLIEPDQRKELGIKREVTFKEPIKKVKEDAQENPEKKAEEGKEEEIETEVLKIDNIIESNQKEDAKTDDNKKEDNQKEIAKTEDNKKDDLNTEDARVSSLLKMSEINDVESFFFSCEYFELKSRIRADFFKRYSKGRIILFIINSIFVFFIENFEYVCYIFMILNHFFCGNIISFFWPFMAFTFGITQYPRPEKLYWKVCIFYSSVVVFIKIVIQQTFWDYITAFSINELNESYTFFKLLGFKKCISDSFVYYIIFDFLLLSVLLINQFMLIRKGLWNYTELEYETIEEANDRIKKFNALKYKNVGRINNFDSEMTNSDILQIFGQNKNQKRLGIIDRINEYYGKNFTHVRNEKPGKDYYLYYTLIMILILIYIIFFYTLMDEDKIAYNFDITTVKQFSGSMVMFALCHLIILVLDRFIYLKNSRKIKKVAYKVYNTQTGEDITASYGNYTKAKQLCEMKDGYEIVAYQNEGSQFGLIIKFILQFIVVISIHFFVFIFFPLKNRNNNQGKKDIGFLNNGYLIIFYLMYCLYFTFSAMQIKYGLADLRKKSSLMKGSNLFYSCVFKIYKAIPFLFELKAFIDWTFTQTSFDIFKWLKFEEIYALLFINKCFAKSYMGRRVGSKIPPIMKIFLGGSSVFGVLLVLFVPLILFSTLNPTSVSNDVIGVKFKLDLSFINNHGAFVANYTLLRINNAEIQNETDTSASACEEKYSDYQNDTYVKTYEKSQVQCIDLDYYSDSNWDISQKSFEKLKSYLREVDNEKEKIEEERKLKAYLTLRYAFLQRHEASSIYYAYEMKDVYTAETNISKIINDDTKTIYDIPDQSNITIQDFYSPLIRVSSGNAPKYIKKDIMSSATLRFVNGEQNKGVYWELVREKENAKGLNFITFTDFFSSVTSGYDALTFYVTFIFVIGQYMRSILMGEAERVIYTEMVNPNKLLNVCEGIRISRIKKDLLQEDKLYYLLIDLMRSPEIVKSITKSSLLFLQKGNIVQDNSQKNEKDGEHTYAIIEKFEGEHRKAFVV